MNRKYRVKNQRWLTEVVLPLVSCLFFIGTAHAAGGGGQWKQAGQSIENTRNQKTESKIKPSNVADLEVRWSVETEGDVSATPAVQGKHVYFPDFEGNLFKVERNTGTVVWQRRVSEYIDYGALPENLNNFSRTTPAIHGNLLIFGDQGGREGDNGGAHMIAVDKHSGDAVWVTTVEPHFAAIITQSATVSGGVVYVGVSSYEEALAAFIPGYDCCSFRGSMAALDAKTGEILWQTSMVPDPDPASDTQFSGNAIWGSSPAVDKKRGQVYIATGNNYSAPQTVLDCVTAAGDHPDAQRACLAPYDDNYFDAVVALDLKTGAVNWSNIVIPFDVWTVSCLIGAPTCPDPQGPDFDFGQAPMLYRTEIGGKKQDLVGVGQKSGVYWSLDPDTGATVWSTQVSPGGLAGGLMWGSAYDGDLIYTSSANSGYQSWDLIDGDTTQSGIWSALNPATGEIVWQTANPANPGENPFVPGTFFPGSNAGGAVTSANGLVYVCSQDPLGYMYVMDADSGDILWEFESGGSCNSGAAVVNGRVYWGSGYAGFGPPNTGNNQLYAFEVPKKKS